MNQSKDKIVIMGGSGFLGHNLAQALIRQNYAVTIISRNRPEAKGAWNFAPWDAHSVGAWKNELDGASAIVNLAGKTVDCVKTAENCDLILRSRVESTQVIGRALKEVATPPSVWVQMSTAHIYGDPSAYTCTEDSAFGYGLAPFVGKAWEEAYRQAVLPHMRQVILRTSFVLGRRGGALPTLARLTKFGLGGKAGHGQQGISWIHEDDMNNLFIAGIEDESMQGVYIASAPNPVSNQDFMTALRRALGVPFGLPATAWMVKLGSALIFNTDPDLVLAGRYVAPGRLQRQNFRFDFPDLGSALNQIYSKSPLTGDCDKPNHPDPTIGMVKTFS
ncbi:MAG: TIGR01777 family oxidoreductase [Anaerolineae bacterium]